MKVLLAALNSKYIHSSLSVRYIKEYSRDLNTEIDVEEYTINQHTDFITAEIYKKKYDLVCFSCYIWNFEEIVDISKRLKIISPDTKILIGGPEVSFDSDEILKKHECFDYVIFGEGEVTFKEFVLALENKTNLKEVDGLTFKENNEIIKNKDRELLKDLNDIPSPFNQDLNVFKNRIIYYESSRGCPFNCEFCLSSTDKRLRFFDIERVKSDLGKLIDARVRQVKFVDRTFNANKKYAMEIMNFIISKNPEDINFHFEVTAHLLDEEMLEFLKKAPVGLFQFEVGVQSTNLKTIEAINRTTNFEKLKYVVEKINSFKNIHQHLDLIAGLPHEDYDSFKKSFDDVYSLKPEKLQLGFLKLLKGSEMRKKAHLHGYKFMDKPTYEVLENDYISYEELLKLKMVEEMVEKFGNENDFRASIEFMIKNVYKSPFKLFEEIANYWEEKNYHMASHSKKTCYKILFEFYLNNINENAELFKEILKFDFLNNNNLEVPVYLKEENFKMEEIKHEFMQSEKLNKKYIPAYEGLSTRRKFAKLRFESFKVDIDKLLNGLYKISDVKTETRKIILFDYGVDKLSFKKSKVYDLTDDLKNHKG